MTIAAMKPCTILELGRTKDTVFEMPQVVFEWVSGLIHTQRVPTPSGRYRTMTVAEALKMLPAEVAAMVKKTETPRHAPTGGATLYYDEAAQI